MEDEEKERHLWFQKHPHDGLRGTSVFNVCVCMCVHVLVHKTAEARDQGQVLTLSIYTFSPLTPAEMGFLYVTTLAVLELTL